MISWGSKIKNFTGSNQIWNRGSPYVGFCIRLIICVIFFVRIVITRSVNEDKSVQFF